MLHTIFWLAFAPSTLRVLYDIYIFPVSTSSRLSLSIVIVFFLFSFWLPHFHFCSVSSKNCGQLCSSISISFLLFSISSTSGSRSLAPLFGDIRFPFMAGPGAGFVFLFPRWRLNPSFFKGRDVVQNKDRTFPLFLPLV